jgi:hypothetical protein
MLLFGWQFKPLPQQLCQQKNLLKTAPFGPSAARFRRESGRKTGTAARCFSRVLPLKACNLNHLTMIV